MRTIEELVYALLLIIFVFIINILIFAVILPRIDKREYKDNSIPNRNDNEINYRNICTVVDSNGYALDDIRENTYVLWNKDLYISNRCIRKGEIILESYLRKVDDN